MSRSATSIRRVLRQRGGDQQYIDDAIAAEVPVALQYNGESHAVMMATPADLEDFAIGFSLSEDIVAVNDELSIESIDEDLDGITIAMTIPAGRARTLQDRQRNLTGRSGCGVCGSARIEAVLRAPQPVASGITINTTALRRALRELAQQQPLNARTGATHAAAWAVIDGEVAVVREDVGRHNALDKLIGALQRDGCDFASGFAVISSRASYEMVQKAAHMGIGLLAAISAPTALAITLAERSGMTLIGFARDDGQAVYCHGQRLHIEAEVGTGT